MTSLAVLVYCNYSTIYIGPYFTQNPADDAIFLAIIQVAAKTQELLCIASLATVVLQALRRELLDEGIPVGLLGSGLWFSQVAFLWSPDFLTAARWSTGSYRRATLYGLIIVAGFIAAFIGPSAAVLLLPRSQYLPAGRISYYLNGNFTDFWPEVVRASTEPQVCSQAGFNLYALCPSGGYDALRQTLSTFNYTNFNDQTPFGIAYGPQLQAQGIEGVRQWHNALIQSQQSLIPPMLSSMHIRGPNWWTAVLQPHAATAAVSQQLVRDWAKAASTTKRGLWSRYQWTYGLKATTRSTLPVVRTSCTQAQNISVNTTQAGFPYLYISNVTGLQMPPVDPAYARKVTWASDLRYADISSLERGPTSHLRSQWLSLPPDSFGDAQHGFSTSGLFLEFPWNDESRAAVSCSVLATWHDYSLVSERSVDYGAWVATHIVDGNDRDDYTDVRYSRPLALDRSWLDLLTPPMDTEPGSSTRDSLEHLLSGTGFADSIAQLRSSPQMYWNDKQPPDGTCISGMLNSSKTDTELWNDTSCGKGSKAMYLEFVVSSLVADGLSRYGSHRAFESVEDVSRWMLRVPTVSNPTLLFTELPSSPPPPHEHVHQSVDVDVVGYAYFASTTTDYLALAVVCGYMLVAGVHLWRSLWLQDVVSSSAWDTITELLVLCQLSPPPQFSQLDNSASGIRRLETYSTMVKVRATQKGNHGNPKQLAVVVDDGTTRCKLPVLIQLVQFAGVAMPALSPELRRRMLYKVEADQKYR